MALKEIRKAVLPLGVARFEAIKPQDQLECAGLVTKLTHKIPSDCCFEALLHLMMLTRPLFAQLQFMKGSINVFHCLHPMTAPLRAGMFKLAFRISQGLLRAIHFSRLILSLK